MNIYFRNKNQNMNPNLHLLDKKRLGKDEQIKRNHRLNYGRSEMNRDLILQSYWGYKIGVSKYLDPRKQQLTVDSVKCEFEKLPRRLRDVVNEIRIVDSPNPHDAMWERVYRIKNFTSFAATEIVDGYSIITFYQNNNVTKEVLKEQLPFYIAHECAHALDNKKAKYLILFSEGSTWQKAMADDEKRGVGSKVSDYARDSNSSKEDFADAVAYYLHPRYKKRFSETFPNRAFVIQSLLFRKKLLV